MSLKDRLNAAQKQNIPVVEKQEQQPKYYNSNTEAQLDSLGILDTLLADDNLNNIFVSGAKNIYLEKKGHDSKSTSTFRDNVQLENLIKKIGQNMGVELNETNPYLEFNHQEGVNIIATLPPLSNVATLFIKNYKDKFANLETLQYEHSISKEVALILEAFCAIKKNILIIGEKNTLKTTLLSALAKKIPTNNRGVVIDCENEFKIVSKNHTTYDFSKIKDNKITKTLIESIVDSNPDKIFLNSKDEFVIANIIKKIKTGYKGLTLTLCAKDSKEAIEKLSQILTENIPYITFQEAKGIILSSFDIIIEVQKDELGRRKISSISEINLSDEENIKKIFKLDYLKQHNSLGIIPLFYEDIKNNSLPIGENIFSAEYKHTYQKNSQVDSQFSKKSANINILKKFKKELPTSNEESEEENSQKEELNGEQLMQKAQEKFDELKKTAQMQGEFELRVQDFEENNDENL